MKYKDYENFLSVHFILVVYLVLIAVIMSSLFRLRYVKVYQPLSGVVMSSNQVMVVVTSKELSWLYHNKQFLIDGARQKYSIERVDKNVLRRAKKNYHQVILNLSVSNNYQANDVVTLGVYQESKSFWSLFFSIWKGG